jgi:phosphoribosylglycinamide formyltransferase, formyltetrahydrofolate-dependent
MLKILQICTQRFLSKFMFKKLQQKWKVNTIRVLLILITFAIGGSLTGYAGKRLMTLTGIENLLLFIPLYILLVTILWPIMVLIISIPLGQFTFFLAYIKKLLRRMYGNKTKIAKSKIPFLSPDKQQKEATAFDINKMNIKQIAIFASGAGSNAQKIIDHFRNSSFIKVSLVVTNKPGAGVIQIAQKENIPLLLIEKEKFFRGDGYAPQLIEAGIDLIVLAGFLWKIPASLINAFPRSIINIHPALLPAFGGKGMYGNKVHQAVIEAGKDETGITIHFVDGHYDNGDIIFQAKCAVLDTDTPESLAQRIHTLEYANYPVIIEQLLQQPSL